MRAFALRLILARFPFSARLGKSGRAFSFPSHERQENSVSEQVITNVSQEHAHGTEWSYEQFLLGIREAFNAGALPFFTVKTDGLWNVYLSNIPEDVRSTYNCNTCRHFIERFGGLISIDESTGETKSVIWDPKHGMPDVLRESVQRLKLEVESLPVEDVFVTSKNRLGVAETDDFKHPYVDVPDRLVYHDALTTSQVQAQRREDIKTLCLALASYKIEDFIALVRLFRSEAVRRHEKFAAHATWLYSLKRLDESRSTRYRRNKIWCAIATGSEGWSHVRSSVLGTMLDDLAVGVPIPTVIERFNEKLDPTTYQRPQAPKAGNILQAEKKFEQLGLESALARRFARLDEVQALWTPTPAKPKSSTGGIFGDLKARGEAELEQKMPAARMSWAKFERTALAFVDRIDVLVPGYGNFVALTTSVDPDARPIIRWDREDRRNPVSHYLYSTLSPASQWKLIPGWHPCATISKTSCAWFDGRDDYPGRLFFLDGAIDTAISNSALFPEVLRSDLHDVRSVVEAWSNTHKLQIEVEHAASALSLDDSHPIQIRTHGPEGTVEYVLDRLE
jgi:hypothetical protein